MLASLNIWPSFKKTELIYNIGSAEFWDSLSGDQTILFYTLSPFPETGKTSNS